MRKFLFWSFVLLFLGASSRFGSADVPKNATPPLRANADSTKKAQTPTILAATLQAAPIAPGQSFKLTFHWKAVPVGHNYSVFVHFVNSSGVTVFQGDHEPPVPTSKWSGEISYRRTIDVPATAAEGTYKIVAGLYTALPENRGWQNLALRSGKGVIAEAGERYQIATFRVDRHAPPPPLDSAGPVTLNLKGYRLTFDETFNDLSVSASGPAGAGGTRWIAHTPYSGDFGDARFTDPDPTAGFPFRIDNGLLKIEAKKDGEIWKAGLLSSVDSQGRGFSQTYGYFEMCAKFPKGAGTWPAFWMLSLEKLKNPKSTGIEVDVVEEYGHAPQSLHTTLHWWPGEGWNQGKHEAIGDNFIVQDMTAGFHRYGLLWDKKQLIWYFDGVELWRQPTPPQAHTPMYLLVDLALGGGWPIQQTPNPSIMSVDYVRAYAKKSP